MAARGGESKKGAEAALSTRPRRSEPVLKGALAELSQRRTILSSASWRVTESPHEVEENRERGKRRRRRWKWKNGGYNVLEMKC